MLIIPLRLLRASADHASVIEPMKFNPFDSVNALVTVA